MTRSTIRTIVTALFGLVASTAKAAPQPLINYFKPMPIVGKLSTTVWGAAAVGARDPANGLEDNGASGGVGPQKETYFYWDGKIVHGNDGKYHLYASHWLYTNGFGPPDGGSTGWQKSIPMQAISDDVMGPYVSQGDTYTQNQEGNNMGHNVTALVAPTGTNPYVLSVGEIVPGQMFDSSSPNGPWTLMGLTKTNANGHSSCGDLSSNFTFTVGPDNRFWATSRGGCVMDSDSVLGTYKVETDSVLPNLENNDNGDAEDECIWYSGGYFHIVYNYWNLAARLPHHVEERHDQLDEHRPRVPGRRNRRPMRTRSGCGTRTARSTTGTTWSGSASWSENGHATHFTFAVTDIDKNTTAVNTRRQQDPGCPVRRRAIRLRQRRPGLVRRAQFCPTAAPRVAPEPPAAPAGQRPAGRAGASGAAGSHPKGERWAAPGGPAARAARPASGRLSGTGGGSAAGGRSAPAAASATGGTLGTGGASATGGRSGSGTGGTTSPGTGGGASSGCSCSTGNGLPLGGVMFAPLLSLLLVRRRKET